MEQDGDLCAEVETVMELTYHGDRVKAGGRCDPAMTVGRRCGWVKIRYCGELLYAKRSPLKLMRLFTRTT